MGSTVEKVEVLKGEKRKLKAAITRQLNDLAGRISSAMLGGQETEEIKQFRKV